MSKKCFMANKDTDHDYFNTPGAVWFVDDGDIAICLPDGVVFVPALQKTPWTITGEPPNLTATPSIDSGTYHGWLKDGILSDDIEGRIL